MHYFLLYHDGTHTEHLAKLIQTIHQFGKEFKVIVYESRTIDTAFKEKNHSILSLPRGGGYWLWKPYIILSTLSRLKEGDILVYLDSKYYFIESFTLWFYSFLQTQNIVVFRNKPNGSCHFMKHWCKMDVIQTYDLEKKVFEQDELIVWAGFMLLRNTSFTRAFIREWLRMCTYENITDSPSILPNSPLFREHRHDQSLLSVLIHKYSIPTHFCDSRYLQDVRNPI